VRLLASVAALLAAAVLVAAAGGGAAGAAPGCSPTLDDGAGPFGRGAPPRRSKIGTGHVLTGIVLSSVDCRPIAGAAIHLWQANRRGEYVRAGSATVVTNAAGRFRLEGPRPVSYEGRQPHIHLRVAAKNHELLHTRYVPASATAKRGTIRLVLLPQRL
jgi:protocatechuate 3,4-dioxygenase beta subunit